MFGHSLFQSGRNPVDLSSYLASEDQGASRSVAAIRRVYDFSTLEGSALERASMQRILSGTRILETQDEVSVEFGHFVVTDQDGNRDFACRVFRNVELELMAVGVSTSEGKPTLKIKAPCKISEDVNQISGIKIPFKRLMSEKPGELELVYAEFPGYEFKTMQLDYQWPTSWELMSVKLTGEMPGLSQISVPHSEIRSWYKSPFLVRWARSTGESASQAL